MAVNGVEIKVGQKWRTADDGWVRVVSVCDQGVYPVVTVDRYGSERTYSDEGHFSKINTFPEHNLVELIEDTPVPAPAPAHTDANELAAETLQSLGWHFVGNCWVQDAQPEQQSALDVQVGGSHYKDCAIQPVEFIHANGLDFFQGNIIKYATRHKDKNGAADLRKAIHYCQLALQLQYGEVK